MADTGWLQFSNSKQVLSGSYDDAWSNLSGALDYGSDSPASTPTGKGIASQLAAFWGIVGLNIPEGDIITGIEISLDKRVEGSSGTDAGVFLALDGTIAYLPYGDNNASAVNWTVSTTTYATSIYGQDFYLWGKPITRAMVTDSKFGFYFFATGNSLAYSTLKIRWPLIRIYHVTPVTSAVRAKRGTRSQINAAASSNLLKSGEIIMSTDEQQMRYATGSNASIAIENAFTVGYIAKKVGNKAFSNNKRPGTWVSCNGKTCTLGTYPEYEALIGATGNYNLPLIIPSQGIFSFIKVAK